MDRGLPSMRHLGIPPRAYLLKARYHPPDVRRPEPQHELVQMLVCRRRPPRGRRQELFHHGPIIMADLRAPWQRCSCTTGLHRWLLEYRLFEYQLRHHDTRFVIAHLPKAKLEYPVVRARLYLRHARRELRECHLALP